MFAAIRRASSFVSSLPTDRRPGSSSPPRKAVHLIQVNGSPGLCSPWKLSENNSRLSVINELADGEKALHPTDRFGDYAVQRLRSAPC